MKKRAGFMVGQWQLQKGQGGGRDGETERSEEVVVIGIPWYVACIPRVMRHPHGSTTTRHEVFDTCIRRPSQALIFLYRSARNTLTRVLKGVGWQPTFLFV